MDVILELLSVEGLGAVCVFLGVQSLPESETAWSDCTDLGLIASERAIWHVTP
jgi:hypothetical protein